MNAIAVRIEGKLQIRLVLKAGGGAHVETETYEAAAHEFREASGRSLGARRYPLMRKYPSNKRQVVCGSASSAEKNDKIVIFD